MFCTQCGRQVEENEEFCPYCKENLNGQKSTALRDSNLSYCTACGHLISLEAEICPGCGIKTKKGIERDSLFALQQRQRTENMIRMQAQQKLEQRKTMKTVISVISTIVFFYGIYLLSKDEGLHWYMMVEWGIVTSTAQTGLVLTIGSVIVDTINHVSFNSYKKSCDTFVSWTPPNLNGNGVDNGNKGSTWICPSCKSRVKIESRLCPQCGYNR